MKKEKERKQISILFVVGGAKCSNLSFTLESIYPHAPPPITEHLEFFTEVEDP